MSRPPRSEESLPTWNWILEVFRRQTRRRQEPRAIKKNRERERGKATKNWRACEGRDRKDGRGRSSDPSASHDAEYESRHVAQNPRDASERDAPDERAGKEGRRDREENSTNAGYFSRWKQTRYVPGNFNRFRFDVSTGDFSN